MLEVQKFLKEKSLGQLQEEFGILTTFHEELPLVILNYDIKSPKTHPIVKECRSLILNLDDWSVVSKGFDRFFNLGDDLDNQKNFNWGHFACLEKIDGSYIGLFWYRDRWILNTRKTFADGICGDSGKTWEELVMGRLNRDKNILQGLDRRYTYIMEYVGPWNKVVKTHAESDLYLLDITGPINFYRFQIEIIAKFMGIKIPALYQMNTQEEVVSYVNEHPESTYEGVVLMDSSGYRIKVKNPRYIALHALKGNGIGFSVKNMLPYILMDGQLEESEELTTYFPEVQARYDALKDRVHILKMGTLRVWVGANHTGSQKDFALSVIGKTPLQAILFQARQKGVKPSSLWKENEALILKVLENEK